MNVLALDTCFGAASVAVRWQSGRGEWLLREAYETLETGHAERIVGMIGEVMAGAGLDYDRLDRIAVTLGPGSFTGLRAGIAAARALALAAGKPVVGLSSLAVMAERANFLLGERRGAGPLAVAADARRGAVYMQVFGGTGSEPLSEPALLTAAEAALALPPGPLVVVGSGAPSVAAAAKRADVTALLEGLQPHARQLVQLAPILAPLDKVNPLYLRPADAKPQPASQFVAGGGR